MPTVSLYESYDSEISKLWKRGENAKSISKSLNIPITIVRSRVASLKKSNNLKRWWED